MEISVPTQTTQIAKWANGFSSINPSLIVYHFVIDLTQG